MASRPLSPEELIEFEASTPQASGSREIPLTGSIDFNVPAEVLPEVSALRQTAREAPYTGLGEFPVVNQTPAAISRGALSGISGELIPAITERTGLADRYDPQDPQFTDPITFGLSEFIANLIPVGTGAKAVKVGLEGTRRLGPQIAKAIMAAAPEALTFGAAMGAAEPLREGEDAGEVAFGAGKGAILTALIAGLIPGGAAVGKRAGTALKNYFVKDPNAYAKASERLLYDVLGDPSGAILPGQIGKYIDTGDLQIGIGTVKQMGGLPSTLRESLPAVAKSKKVLEDQVNEFASQNSKFKIKNVFNSLANEITESRRVEAALDPQGIEALKKAVNSLSGDMTLAEALAVQRELNLLSKKVLSRKQIDIKAAQADPDYALIDSMRRKLSNVIDDAFTGITGNLDNPYRRWGTVTKLEEFLQNRFDNLRGVKQKGMLGRMREKGPIKGILPEENEMRTADDAITDLFDITPEFKAPKLSAEEKALRLNRSVKTPQQVEAEALAAQQARTQAGAVELKEMQRMKRYAARASEAAAKARQVEQEALDQVLRAEATAIQQTKTQLGAAELREAERMKRYAARASAAAKQANQAEAEALDQIRRAEAAATQKSLTQVGAAELKAAERLKRDIKRASAAKSNR